jgi:hypothetical protein
MARTEEIFTFSCCFFCGVVAPLDLKELDRLAPYDTTLLIQDLDRMFGSATSGNTTSTGAFKHFFS